MDGYFADLNAFNAALALDPYDLYDVELDAVVVRVGIGGSPPVRFVTNDSDSSIMLRPNDPRDDNSWHTFTASTPVLAGAGNGTMGSVSVGNAGAALGEEIKVVMTDATHFDVFGSLGGRYLSGKTGSAYTGSPLYFTITAGGTAFVAGDAFTIIIS